jgi:hypothetical protein
MKSSLRNSKITKITRIIPKYLIIVIVVFLNQACNSDLPPSLPTDQEPSIGVSPSPDQGLTIAAYETQLAGLTQTAGYTPEPSATSTSTVTPIPPTTMPTPRITPTLRNCNWAEFVRDISIPDGTVLNGGETFSKTWRLRNIGDCPWTTDYDIVFVGGESFNAPNRIGMPTFVGPSEMVDITILMEAPVYPGNYRGYFMLADRQGEQFGTGADADGQLWVDVIVRSPDEVSYDFAQNYCRADWKSSIEGDLPCPGDLTAVDTGFVSFQENPIREDGSVENEPALIMSPDSTNYGFIYGIYPSITIRKGDLFRSVIGCSFDSPGCDITFELRYLIQGEAMRTIKSWEEGYDGIYHSVSTDLSDLAGYTVNLILYVGNNGSSENSQGVWIAPRILR